MKEKDIPKKTLSVYRKPLDKLEDALTGENGGVWSMEFKKFLRKKPCWVKTPENEMARLARESTKILKFYGTAVVPATTEKFIAKEKFVVNTDDDAEVKISYVGGIFQREFLDGEGVIEEPHPAILLYRYKLKYNSIDKSIMADLEEREATTLSEIYALMKKQRRGQKGKLLTNGLPNIYYVRGASFAVIVNYNGKAWCIVASSVKSLSGWVVGSLVFSRTRGVHLII